MFSCSFGELFQTTCEWLLLQIDGDLKENWMFRENREKNGLIIFDILSDSCRKHLSRPTGIYNKIYLLHTFHVWHW